MTLTEIEYGSLASSTVLNNNFQYLQDKITELSALITSETSSFSSSVATLNNSITNLLSYKEAFIPIGTIISSQSSDIPSGFLLCDGSEIKIDEYEDLYDVIGTTYGQTDSTTFCLPDLKDQTLWGKSTQTTLGQSLEAGLPNITGSRSGFTGSLIGSATGAFYPYGSDSMNQNVGSRGAGTGFDASKCSPIYGKSTTVQPPAVVTNFIIKY